MRDYYEVHKRGDRAQGKPHAAKKPGTCTICTQHYPARTPVVAWGKYATAHPECMSSEVVTRRLN